MSNSTQRIPIAVLGATGAVGQKIIRLIEGHEQFTVSELVASDVKSGKKYGEACTWREASTLPESIAHMRLKQPHEVTSTFVLSALPAKVAQDVEPMLAERGHWVISNASAHRMRQDVPLLIPEVNSDHLALLDKQQTSGRIITNSNCAAAPAALALRPLTQLGQIEHVSIVTLQAISGAGYPGLPACDILSNSIPYIEGEEEKIESELKKMLGTISRPASFSVTAHVNRVPVQHGHSTVLHVHFSQTVAQEDLNRVFREAKEAFPQTYKLYEDSYAPQPLRHLHDKDNRVHIGRIKRGVGGKLVGLTAMSHNLVRGAAGAAILNLETVQKLRETVCV